jgi:hypothetical protein
MSDAPQTVTERDDGACGRAEPLVSEGVTRRELSIALRGLARAQSQAFRYRQIIAAYSAATFGCDPAEVDNDAFIDACDGGAGACEGMTAAEFDASMRRCLSHANRY